jgi:hypothetical protein
MRGPDLLTLGATFTQGSTAQRRHNRGWFHTATNRELHTMRHRLGRRTAVAAISIAIAAGSAFAVAASSGAGRVLDLARGHQTAPVKHK